MAHPSPFRILELVRRGREGRERREAAGRGGRGGRGQVEAHLQVHAQRQPQQPDHQVNILLL